jgi:hypothetical protein
LTAFKRKFNFSAGRSCQPVECLQQAARDLLEWQGTGMSVSECYSTRSDLPAVGAEITTEHCCHALLFAAAGAILVTRQPVSVGHRGRSAVARGIDNQADAATFILIHPLGVVPIGH